MLTLPIKAKAESLLGVQAESLVYETYYITSAFHYDLSPWMKRGVGGVTTRLRISPRKKRKRLSLTSMLNPRLPRPTQPSIPR